jgi:hypothetical protein
MVVTDLGKSIELWVAWVGRKIPDTHLTTTSEVQRAFNLMGKRGWKDHLLVMGSLQGMDTESREQMTEGSNQLGGKIARIQQKKKRKRYEIFEEGDQEVVGVRYSQDGKDNKDEVERIRLKIVSRKKIGLYSSSR